MNIKILSLLGTLSCCSLAQAATYYISPTGNNNNPGTLVEFSETLANGTWAVNASATTALTTIDATFERVVVTDSNHSTKRFARVRVTTS